MLEAALSDFFGHLREVEQAVNTTLTSIYKVVGVLWKVIDFLTADFFTWFTSYSLIMSSRFNKTLSLKTAAVTQQQTTFKGQKVI